MNNNIVTVYPTLLRDTPSTPLLLACCPPPYDPSFSERIGGYPVGCILSHATRADAYWESSINHNRFPPTEGHAWKLVAMPATWLTSEGNK